MDVRWTPALLGLLAVGIGTALLLTADDPDAAPSDDPVVVIDMEASRYAYEPGSGPPINVTEGATVLLRITSVDVTHGLAIPEYGINVEIPPGQTVEVRFSADKPGTFAIYCTVFCGAGHPQHQGTLHVA